jgi:hypothetical protein
MKRCPECDREYDLSMSFCLDDGAELLYGPASMDEPATAVFGTTASRSVGKAAKTAIFQNRQGHDDPTSVIRSPKPEASNQGRFRALILVSTVVFAIILLGGFFSYRYFATANSQQIESIAVLPFVNESGDPDLEYLSDGMSESLMSSLSELPNLSVKSRSSAFRYKGSESDVRKIGSELKVQAVLNGHVTQRGDQLH